MTDFDYHCKLCGNNQTLDHEDNDWLCICQKKPQGINTFHICGECGNRRWGFRGEVQCEVCEARKLSDVKITVEHLGDARNMKPRKTQEEIMKNFDKNWERFEIAKQKAIQNKIDTQKAILIVPKLLTDLNNKLDKLLAKQEDTETDDIETDEDGYVIFAKGGSDVQ